MELTRDKKLSRVFTRLPPYVNLLSALGEGVYVVSTSCLSSCDRLRMSICAVPFPDMDGGDVRIHLSSTPCLSSCACLRVSICAASPSDMDGGEDVLICNILLILSVLMRLTSYANLCGDLPRHEWGMGAYTFLNRAPALPPGQV